jgi:M3 family oligoendopeptidase
MQRNSWNAEDVAAFRRLVKSELIPVVCKLKEAQAKRLGIDSIHFYDDGVMFPDGNTKPKGTPDEIFAAGRRMYTEMSKETAEFFDFMLEHDLFDVLSKEGKYNGGYCISIPKYGFPFIFANFNGTTGDIDVLTHEAGHAFADYQAGKIPGLLLQLQSPTYEACEVHSMSMEFFAWKYMEWLVEDADKYRISHLTDAFSFIPYGTIVDEFQHIAYGNPNLTPAERNRAYLDLEKQYRPYIDLSDSPFINEGRRWQYQAHIYERPFYYIDYCFAQITALYFRSLAQENYASAWEKYMKYVSFAGTKRFTDLLGGAGLPSPFEKATFDAVVKSTLEFLGK